MVCTLKSDLLWCSCIVIILRLKGDQRDFDPPPVRSVVVLLQSNVHENDWEAGFVGCGHLGRLFVRRRDGGPGEGMWLAARSVDVLVLSGRSEKAGAFLQNLL